MSVLPIRFPEFTSAGLMKLNSKTISRLALPAGKTDHIIFDEDLPSFGIRLRGGGKITWIIQYRVGSKQRRVTLGRSRLHVRRAPSSSRRDARLERLLERVAP